MIGATFDFLVKFPIRCKTIFEMVNDPKLSQTYYPEEETKTKKRALLDNLWWLFRYQQVNKFYYSFGFDRKRGVDPSEYLAYADFRKLRDGANARANALATAGDWRKRGLSYRFLMGDKFIFGTYLTALGFSTPRIFATGNDKSITWLTKREKLPLDSLLERDVDGFWKEVLADGAQCVHAIQIDKGDLFIDGQKKTIEQLRASIRGTFLIQERVKQHPEMSKIYPNAVNTVRLVTTMINGEVKPFGALLRMGANGSIVDNWSAGGVAANINLQTGEVDKYATFKPGYGTKIDRHPNTDVVFKGFKVPLFDQVLQEACDLHKFFSAFHSIGWDIAITPTGTSFLEGNDDWGLQSVPQPYGGLRDEFLAMLAVER